MSNLKRINERSFSDYIAQADISEMVITTEGDKKIFTFYSDVIVMGQKTVQGERVRYYLREDVVKALPQDKQQKFGHKGQRKQSKKEVSP